MFRYFSTHLSVDPGGGELVLDDHDDDAEHAHDERVVADPLPLLEQRLPTTQAVGQAVGEELPDRHEDLRFRPERKYAKHGTVFRP